MPIGEFHGKLTPARAELAPAVLGEEISAETLGFAVAYAPMRDWARGEIAAAHRRGDGGAALRTARLFGLALAPAPRAARLSGRKPEEPAAPGIAH